MLYYFDMCIFLFYRDARDRDLSISLFQRYFENNDQVQKTMLTTQYRMVRYPWSVLVEGGVFLSPEVHVLVQGVLVQGGVLRWLFIAKQLSKMQEGYISSKR